MNNARFKPIIFSYGNYTKSDISSFKKNKQIWKIFDIYKEQLGELFEIQNPSLKFSENFKEKQSKFIQSHAEKSDEKGDWVYFPWNGNLVHMVKRDDYYLLRTNRNRNLINLDEERKLSSSCIGVVGLSVGAGTALNLINGGITNTIKLAEFDDLSTTNLNRLRAGVESVGLPKIEIVSQQIYEINPYSELFLFEKGLILDNLESFMNGDRKPELIFEAIDDFQMKIQLRMSAREHKIPVIMFTNLGDSMLVDVERYDLDPELPLFNGLLGELPEEILKNPDADKNKYAVALVGIDNVPARAIESVKEIGKTLAGRPQLIGTVAISSGLATYVARKILLGEDLPSGRRRIVFSELL